MIALNRYTLCASYLLTLVVIAGCKARFKDAPLPDKIEPVGIVNPAPSPNEDVPGSWVQKALQEKVVKEAQDKGLEVFGLFSQGGWQVDDAQYVVTIDKAAGTADLHYYAPLQKSASIHRVTDKDLSDFRAVAEPFDSQDDYNPAAFDGFRYNYLHYNPGKPTARLYMNNPGVAGKAEGYVKLLRVFRKLPRK